MRQLTESGVSAAARRSVPEKLRYRRLVRFTKGGFQDA